MINKYIYILLLLSPLFIFNSCDEEDTIKFDEDFVVPSITLYHVNPLTGEDYTEEELASIKHDPRFKEYYQESQEIELAVITDQLPVKTNIRLYEDNSLIVQLISLIRRVRSTSPISLKPMHQNLAYQRMKELYLYSRIYMKTSTGS